MASSSRKSLLRTQIDTIIDALNEIESATDRAVAITACAWLDVRVERSIRARLATDIKAQDKFFDLDSGITAEAKITLAYLLGVFTDDTRKNLLAMCKIRNRFAHRLEINKFDHQNLDPFFKDLTLPWKITKKSHWVIGGDLEPITFQSSKRTRFIAATKVLIDYLVNDAVKAPEVALFTPAL